MLEPHKDIVVASRYIALAVVGGNGIFREARTERGKPKLRDGFDKMFKRHAPLLTHEDFLSDGSMLSVGNRSCNHALAWLQPPFRRSDRDPRSLHSFQ